MRKPGPQNDYASLLRALDEQATLSTELEALCTRQKEAIAGDDADAVLGLLSQRQGLIDRLAAMDRQVAALRTEVESASSSLEATQRQEISHRASAVAASIRRVIASDSADRDVLERRRSVLATQLADINGKRRALSAYGTTPSSDSAMYQDRRV